LALERDRIEEMNEELEEIKDRLMAERR